MFSLLNYNVNKL